jgi:hypothetical protein
MIHPENLPMSFFPSPEPLSTSPDAGRYERSLQRAADRRSSDGSASWSLDDAAAFWLPGWEPPRKKLASLPADGVMGLAKRSANHSMARASGPSPTVG